MTIRGIRDIVRQLSTQELKRELLRVEPENSTDVEVQQCAAEIDRLTAEYNRAIDRLSMDVWEEKCIYLFWVKNYSWKKIAQIVTGRVDTADSLRVRCSKYKW